MDKQKQLEELQKTLSQIYLKNIEFFKINHINIYEKIVFFEKQNIQNYSLEFIDDEFKLFDLKTKQNLYIKEPFSDSLNRLNNFSLSNAFTLIKMDQLTKKNHYEGEINSYIYLNEYIKELENIKIKINKFIFIGTLLGVHINDFHNNLNAKSYLIIEPNIEVFRLSLFLCDYESLCKNSKLFFAINENNSTLEKITKNFLENQYELNHLIHFELSSENNSYLIEELQNIFIHNSQMRYPFSDFIISLKRGYNYFFEEKKSIINLSQNQNLFENKKVLFLGAGVSLAKNLEWLYLNQEKFVIVASSAVLKHLRILEIIPDTILAIDGQKEPMIEQFNTDSKMYKDSIILASIKLDTELFLKLKDTKIFFMQNSLELFSNYGFLSGVTVGDIGIDIIAKLGAKEIYLLGIDASIDSKNGKTHIGTHKSSRKLNLNKKHNGDFRKDIVYVKGNFEEKVPTFKEYLEMIESAENIIFEHFEFVKVYNLGDGAYFKGATSLKIEKLKSNLEKIDKKKLNIELLENLKKISKQTLEEIDIKDIQKEKKVLKKLNNIKIENFHNEFKMVFKKYPNSMICNIFDRFFKLILPYNLILNSNEANEILEKQIFEALNSFNSIFDKIDTKLKGKK
ncbi:hypothetical protein AAX26_00592 [Aliarcobacter thereius]|uniref:Motility associated factor glycosyltransferase family protein n=1 Tax=Aliarcobacter thereius TaxID=544718 RepID=A0A1C0B8K7_9BACT|nr:6-hydroxymethylpterin diphosphokinase MptE-like protein [Aliarcobacter thereius]OCL87507.1 hypothetical protein AAX26_00592 [Aliarcobacter thereius]OCL99948.1 hypothetical protein AAX29_01001 [Aliarcobacter thereius]TLS73340.1 motility associated factor glycosyltransferase family protein [Aliarcobacter thereius]HJE03666.1 DUF115 domain-containing protein [Aliarcobacter thereius]